jgi:hypothetical protein
VDASGKAAMARMGMPSDTKIDIPISGAGSYYTAPADGYIYFTKTHTGTTSGNATVMAFPEGSIPPFDAGDVVTMTQIYGFNNGQILAITHPVRKGQVAVFYFAYALAASAKFIPAQGEE